jgi:sugar lactone lactonase YvrE
MKIQLISQVVSELGESPIYNQSRNEVVWTDITGLKWIRSNLFSGETIVQESAGMVSALAVREKNGYIAAVKEGFATINENERYTVTNQILDKSQRMNDGKCDAKGRFWAGSTNFDFEKGKGKLFRLDTDFECEVILSELTLPNGMDWSPDGSYFYLIDSLDYKLWRFNFELESGSITSKTVFYEFNPAHGIPDGLSISSNGYILVAMYGGNSIKVISPKGELEQTLKLPLKNPTSCTFVGKNLENLLVTSAFLSSAGGEMNLNGRTLLLSDLGLTGKIPNYFRG